MNWYRLAQSDPQDISSLLQGLRSDFDKKYDEIGGMIETDNKIHADTYDNIGRLKMLNYADRAIEKHFGEYGWKARQI